jgi:hypothetical protein
LGRRNLDGWRLDSWIRGGHFLCEGRRRLWSRRAMF